MSELKSRSGAPAAVAALLAAVLALAGCGRAGRPHDRDQGDPEGG